MVLVKRLVLDVLKPHQPNSLDFSRAIADLGSDYRVCLTVNEIDENTETLVIDITAEDIDYDAIKKTISSMGGSVHSLDRIEVNSAVRATEPEKSGGR